MSCAWVAALPPVSVCHGFLVLALRLQTCNRKPDFLYLWAGKKGGLFIYFCTRGNLCTLNTYILAGPEHKFAFAEETVAKISVWWYLKKIFFPRFWSATWFLSPCLKEKEVQWMMKLKLYTYMCYCYTKIITVLVSELSKDLFIFADKAFHFLNYPSDF